MPQKKVSSQMQPDVSGWIDISIPFRHKMLHFPDGPAPTVIRLRDHNRGDNTTTSDLHCVTHTGTHIDAPLHFIRNGNTIDKMPLDTTIGLARVIEIRDPESIKIEELADYNIQKGERILFKTLNSSRVYNSNEFSFKFVYIVPEAAEYLVERGIRLIGFDYIVIAVWETEKDYPSNAEYLDKSGIHRVHRTFLKNNVYILEGINLSGVKAGQYELIALPIRLENGDAGLTRAILRPLNK
jgi:arylformamidase